MGLLKKADPSALRGFVPVLLSVIYPGTDVRDGLDYAFSTAPTVTYSGTQGGKVSPSKPVGVPDRFFASFRMTEGHTYASRELCGVKPYCSPNGFL